MHSIDYKTYLHKVQLLMNDKYVIELQIFKFPVNLMWKKYKCCSQSSDWNK